MSLDVNCQIVAHQFEKFQIILNADNIGYMDLFKSLDVQENRSKVFKAGEGAGASGSFFFFSKNNKFLIKTMNSAEADRFLSIIDDYINHIVQTKNESLLARIYGIFTIKT